MTVDVTPRFPLTTVQPGAYGIIDATALQNAESVVGAPVVGILGDCKGGQPNVALSLTTQAAAIGLLRSGPLLDCVRAALLRGASKVLAVRVGNGIAAATKALAGASATPVTLTAKGYGTWTNSIKVTVAANNAVTITYVDALGQTYTETFSCGSGATAQDVADFINGKKAGTAASAWVTAAVTTGTMPLNTASIAAMTGGADTGTIVSGDWTTGLTALETEDVSLVCVATGDSTVHAQALTHCNAMSVPSARHERTAVFGAVAGESVAQQVTRIGSLRDKRAQLVYPGITLLSETGATTAYAPFVAAAYIAGAHAGLPDPATALTHEDLAILDVEARLSLIPGGDTDTLLTVGVSPIGPKPGGGFWLVDSLSGYNADDSFRDYHKIRTADEVNRRLRTRLEARFVGGKGLTGTADSIRLETIAELTDEVTEQLLVDFLEDEVNVIRDPANARRYLVTAPVMLPDTVKYILITIQLQPPGAAAA